MNGSGSRIDIGALPGRPCSAAATLQVVGEKWALLAVREIFFGNHRFEAIARNTGAPRDRLAARLRSLEHAGVVERRPYNERPPRHEYHLTEAGRDLAPVIRALLDWGDRWVHEEPPVVMVHEPVVTTDAEDRGERRATAHTGMTWTPRGSAAPVARRSRWAPSPSTSAPPAGTGPAPHPHRRHPDNPSAGRRARRRAAPGREVIHRLRTMRAELSGPRRRMGGMTEITGSTTDSVPALTTDSVPEWEKRFRAPRVSLPDWAEDAPDRSLFVSNATGTYELYAWDRATGEQRQVTDRPNGTTDGVLSPDGEWIWWFYDTDGDEFGVWMRQPFDGARERTGGGRARGSRARALVPGGARASAGTGRRSSAGRPTRTARRSMSYGPGRPPVEIYRHRESAGVGDLSHDGTLIAVEHTEHGDAMHSALRVLRPDGTTVAELDDTKGGTQELGLEVLGFAPVDGDTRLLVGHQRRGRWEPMVWDVADRRGDGSGDRSARRRGRRVVSGRLRAAGRAQLRGPQRPVAVRPGVAAR